MKTQALVLFFLCSVLTYSTLAQITLVKGVTKNRTVIYSDKDLISIDKIKAGETIDIVGADTDFFKIKYKDGFAAVRRININYNKDEIHKLQNISTNSPKTNSLNNDNESIINNQIGTMKANTDSNKYEIDYLRHCLGEYNKQVMKGYCISITGTTVMFASVLLDDKNITKIGIAAGGLLSAVGAITIIDGQKWTKRAYVGPTGVGIKFVF